MLHLAYFVRGNNLKFEQTMQSAQTSFFSVILYAENIDCPVWEPMKTCFQHVVYDYDQSHLIVLNRENKNI